MFKLNHLIYITIVCLLAIQAGVYVYADDVSEVALGYPLERQQMSADTGAQMSTETAPLPPSEAPATRSDQPESVNPVEYSAQWQRDIAARSQALPARLRTEPRDSSWAQPLEQQIRDSFIQDEQLRAFALANVQCRTELCAISIAMDTDASVEVMSSITALVRQQPWYRTFQHMVFHGQRNQANQITLFLE